MKYHGVCESLSIGLVTLTYHPALQCQRLGGKPLRIFLIYFWAFRYMQFVLI